MSSGKTKGCSLPHSSGEAELKTVAIGKNLYYNINLNPLCVCDYCKTYIWAPTYTKGNEMFSKTL